MLERRAPMLIRSQRKEVRASSSAPSLLGLEVPQGGHGLLPPQGEPGVPTAVTPPYEMYCIGREALDHM